MKFKSKLIFTSVLALNMSAGAHEAVLNHFQNKSNQDLSTILVKNLPMIQNSKSSKIRNGEGEDRFNGAYFDGQNSCRKIGVSYHLESYEFSPRHNSGWDEIPLNSRYVLGKTHGRAQDGTFLRVIGDHCDVWASISCYRDGEILSSEDHGKILDQLGCRAFALVQYQAYKEREIRNSYQVFDAPNFGAKFTLDDNNFEFTITTPTETMKGCLGSYDFFLGDKKIKLKSMVLLNEDGVPVVDDDFLNMMRQHS